MISALLHRDPLGMSIDNERDYNQASHVIARLAVELEKLNASLAREQDAGERKLLSSLIATKQEDLDLLHIQIDNYVRYRRGFTWSKFEDYLRKEWISTWFLLSAVLLLSTLKLTWMSWCSTFAGVSAVLCGATLIVIDVWESETWPQLSMVLPAVLAGFGAYQLFHLPV